MSSSYDSFISKDVRAGQQARRIDLEDKFASSTSEEGRSFSDNLLQVRPSGATLDDNIERGPNEIVYTTNPPRHDSTFLEDTAIQLEKLDYDPSNSQNYLKNMEVKGQGSTSQKSTPEKSDQSEDIRASSSGSGISITMSEKGREKVGDDHLNIAVGSATGNSSKMNDSKQSDHLPGKMDFKNKIMSEEQNNEFSHNFIQAKQDGDFQAPSQMLKDIPSPVPDAELEEWERMLDNLPSVSSDYKRDDLHKDEVQDQGTPLLSFKRILPLFVNL